jgi:hypothetical protein
MPEAKLIPKFAQGFHTLLALGITTTWFYAPTKHPHLSFHQVPITGGWPEATLRIPKLARHEATLV